MPRRPRHDWSVAHRALTEIELTLRDISQISDLGLARALEELQNVVASRVLDINWLQRQLLNLANMGGLTEEEVAEINAIYARAGAVRDGLMVAALNGEAATRINCLAAKLSDPLCHIPTPQTADEAALETKPQNRKTVAVPSRPGLRVLH